MAGVPFNSDSVQSRYSTFANNLIQKIKAYEDSLPLRDETCRSRFLLHPSPTSKVCLFFHGFTATPEQFLTIGEAFFQAGYNVLIPLLPGHGIAGDWNKDHPPPLPEEQQIYKDFGIYWLQMSQELGDKVVIGGLSGGSTLCAWLALERAVQIDRALLFAPYLSGSNMLVDLVVRSFNIYFEWQTKPGLADFGYDGFLMPALRLFLNMGKDIFEMAKNRYAAPMFIISSASDLAVGSEEHEDLFKTVIQHQPKSWYYCFSRVWDIQHNMMTEAEGNEHVDLVIAIAKAYIESDVTWDEVEKMRHLMQQGYSFQNAVDQLDLGNRVSPDLVIMLTMADD